jgi:hypothetical protein
MAQASLQPALKDSYVKLRNFLSPISNPRLSELGGRRATTHTSRLVVQGVPSPEFLIYLTYVRKAEGVTYLH